MTKVMVTEEYLENTGDAIREKNGSSSLYTPAQFASAIRAIDTSGNTGSKTISANGTYSASADSLDGYDEVTVNVPNTYASGDEGKVVSSGALVAQTSRSVTANGTYDTTTNDSVVVDVPTGGGSTLGTKTITQNGTYNASSDSLDGYSQVTVNVSGGGGSVQGFELYAADSAGGSRKNSGVYDNGYFACYFDDNMSSTYTLNGNSYTYSTIAIGQQQTLATTVAVSDNEHRETTRNNAIIEESSGDGSVFTASHGDSGSYISVVGGWTGYPRGGTIYEHAAYGTTNTITMNSAHSTLLVFVGACASSAWPNPTTLDINGATYTVDNIGANYGRYGMYGAIEIDNNTDTEITVTLSQSCPSYVSIIGID